MKQISNKEYEAYQQYQTDKLTMDQKTEDDFPTFNLTVYQELPRI